MKSFTRFLDLTFVATSMFLFVGCGSSSTDMTQPPGGGTISGVVTKGPVSGATMKALAISNGTMGAQIGAGTTDGQGNFTVSIGDYSGPVMLQMSGGTYTDEATNTRMAMQAGDVMTSLIPSVTAGSTMSGIQVTPLTAMAQLRAQNMAGGMTVANIGTANAEVGNYFSVSDILHTMPMDPLVAGSGTTATQDAKNYGMTLAAMSQYAATVGMPHSSGVVTAMMDDASDGVMDGKLGASPITMGGGMMGGSMMQATAGTSGLATAMSQFVGSSMNKSGVTVPDIQTLINVLNTSSGVIQ